MRTTSGGVHIPTPHMATRAPRRFSRPMVFLLCVSGALVVFAIWSQHQTGSTQAAASPMVLAKTNDLSSAEALAAKIGDPTDVQLILSERAGKLKGVVIKIDPRATFMTYSFDGKGGLVEQAYQPMRDMGYEATELRGAARYWRLRPYDVYVKPVPEIRVLR